VGLAVGDRDKTGQQAIVVEADVDFGRALGGTELRPGKHRQTQVDGGGIQGVELVFEAEAVAWSQSLAASQQFMEQGLIERVGLLFVDPGQRGACHLGAAEVIELGDLGREVAGDVAQAGPAGQLPKAQGNELGPARHLAQFLALVMPVGEGLEFMSRNKF